MASYYNREPVAANTSTLISTYNGTNGCQVASINIQGTPGVFENTWYKVSDTVGDQTALQNYSDGYRVVMQFTLGVQLNEGSAQGVCFRIKKDTTSLETAGGICHTIKGDGANAGYIGTNLHIVRWYTNSEWSDTKASAASTVTSLTDPKYGLILEPNPSTALLGNAKGNIGAVLKATWYQPKYVFGDKYTGLMRF